MRIVAGELKGRKLFAPSDKSIRPTSGKAKEGILNMLQWDIYDSVVLDLFSGSGNLGIEAISRGARKCYFSDASKDSLKLIRDNIEMCRIEDRSVIMAGDYRKNIASMPEKADIIFMDPPYSKGYIEKAFECVRENDILSNDGIIVTEHGSDEKLPDELFGFTRIKEKRYGISIVSLYKKDGQD